MKDNNITSETMTLSKMTKDELQMFIISNNDGLYEMFDESRFLSDGYSLEEMKEITHNWILSGDETEVL